jgi:hypothetical protein
MASSETGHGLSKAIGVQAYSSWDEGLEATAKTLTNGLYKEILAALSRSAAPDETLRVIAKSPWGGFGGYKVPIGGASIYQAYRSAVFPGGGSFGFMPSLPNPVEAIKDLFDPKTKTSSKVGAIMIGVGALAGFAMLIHVLRKPRTKSKMVES